MAKILITRDLQGVQRRTSDFSSCAANRAAEAQTGRKVVYCTDETTVGSAQPAASIWGDVGDWLVNKGKDYLGDKLNPNQPNPFGPTGYNPPIPNDPCPGGFRIPGTNRCFEGPIQPQRPTGTDMVPHQGQGTPVHGRYGVGEMPETSVRTVRKCPKGMKLGKDGVCYTNISRTNREWDPGARPLLTGGEMSAITKAARAARRLETTKKKLKKVHKAIHKVV